MFKFTAPLTLLLLNQALCQTNSSSSSSRILGIGLGTLIIIIAIIFSIIWCLACRSSSRPQLYSLIGLLVPAILILAFVLTPKQSERSTTTEETDSNFIPHIVFMVFSVLGFLILGIYLLFSTAFTYKKAKNVARAAFLKREEQQEPLNQNEDPDQPEEQPLNRPDSNELGGGLGQRVPVPGSLQLQSNHESENIPVGGQ